MNRKHRPEFPSNTATAPTAVPSKINSPIKDRPIPNHCGRKSLNTNTSRPARMITSNPCQSLNCLFLIFHIFHLTIQICCILVLQHVRIKFLWKRLNFFMNSNDLLHPHHIVPAMELVSTFFKFSYHIRRH